MPMNRTRLLRLLLLVGVMLQTSLMSPPAGHAQPYLIVSRTFPQPGKTVSGKYLEYWLIHGGPPQQGFPISEEFTEKSELNGQTVSNISSVWSSRCTPKTQLRTMCSSPS